jgi:hypothetical protein
MSVLDLQKLALALLQNSNQNQPLSTTDAAKLSMALKLLTNQPPQV